MNASKCDRCKKFYIPTEHECGLLHLKVNNSCHPSWPSGLNYDFCPKCMKIVDDIIVEVLNNA